MPWELFSTVCFNQGPDEAHTLRLITTVQVFFVCYSSVTQVRKVCATRATHTQLTFLHKENAPMEPAPRSRNRTAWAPEAPSCPSQSPCTQGWPLSWLLLARICFCALVFLAHVRSRCCAIPSAAFLTHRLCVGAPVLLRHTWSAPSDSSAGLPVSLL